MLIKICGLTETTGLAAAVEAGADAVGFVFAPSPRRIDPAKARGLARSVPSHLLKVGVFVSPAPAELEEIVNHLGLDLAQVHGDLQAIPSGLTGRLIKPVRVGFDAPLPELARYEPRFLLLDTYRPGKAGGTGRVFPWEEAEAYRDLNIPLLIAGGLRPENVRTALETARPDGVDVSSGVESAPGIKDPEKIAAFVRAVREWEITPHPCPLSREVGRRAY